MAETQTADLALVRELNEWLVLDRIRQDGPISRAELSRRSNLSRSTVSSIISTLLAAGLVDEIGVGHSLGGRRPIMLQFNYQSSYAIGVAFAMDSLSVLLTDLQATPVRQVRRPLDRTASMAQCIAQLAALIEETLRDSGVPTSKISGVGVGVPGPLIAASGRLAGPALPGWEDAPLHQLLSEALGLPVYLDNDANLGALAEFRWGAARGLRNVAYVYLGTTGVGAGLILDGQLYRGDLGSAGEIGHVRLDSHGPTCRCGSDGCLEAFAGIQALLGRARAAELSVAQIEDLVALAQSGNQQALVLIEQAGTHLGIALASLLNLLNPGRVVVGGALAHAGDLLLLPLRQALGQRGLPVAVAHVDLTPGQLGDDVIAVGAVALVVQQVFSRPSLLRLGDTPASPDQPASLLDYRRPEPAPAAGPTQLGRGE